MTAGARYEDNSEFGNEFVPRGSVAYELTQTDTVFRGAAGKGFKAPTFTEQFAQGFATGNPDLDPEKSYSWEVGVDQALWKNKLVLGATYFYQKFDDLIAFINRPAPAPDYDNIQEAESQGIELMALCKPGFGLTLGGNYTYLDTEVKDDGGVGGPSSPFEEGKDLLRRPEHKASGYVNWAWKGFLPMSANPRRVDPPEGFLRSAGHDLFAEGSSARKRGSDGFKLSAFISLGSAFKLTSESITMTTGLKRAMRSRCETTKMRMLRF